MGRIVETRELYKETVNNVTKSVDNWLSFLDSSSWNFKYDFDDQILIYAQRPDARACATMDEWNRKVKPPRWVNKGADYIFVFDKSPDRQYPFKLVFDIADTNNRNNTEYKLWDIKPEYEQEVIDSLEANFGDIGTADTLAKAINVTGYNIVEDNIQDYMQNIKNHIKGTSLENLPDEQFEIFVNASVMASVSYMMMTRCGINPKENMSLQDFSYINYFNNFECTTVLGQAVSDIAEMALREIARTVITLQNNEKKRNRTFEKNNQELYDKEKNKGGIENDEDRIHERGRLQYTEPSNDNAGDTNREVFKNEVQLPIESPESRTNDIRDERRINETLDRDTGNSNEENQTNSGRNGETRGDNGGNESQRSDEVDSTDEQLEANSRGNSSERIDLHLEVYKKDENSNVHYVVVDEKINQILSKTPFLSKSSSEIINYFENEKDIEKRANFLKEIINDDATEITVDNQIFNYKKYENGVLFWQKGFSAQNIDSSLPEWEKDFKAEDRESFVKWKELTYHFDSMILLHQLKDRYESPRNERKQLDLIEAENNNIDFEFTQEFVDRFLQEQFEGRKFSIYEQFTKSLSSKENAEFVKRLYGQSGGSHTIKGSGIGYNTDAKGITFNRGYFDPSAREQLFNWYHIEKRISELIKLDRYLNSKEKEEYSKWLEKEEQDRLFQEAVDRVDQIEDNEQKSEFDEHYEYHLGDKVYIGADEYEIASINKEKNLVTLYDPRFPLLNKEMEFEEFEIRVRGISSNNHLIVKEPIKNEFNDEKNEEQVIDITQEISDVEEITEEIKVPDESDKEENQVIRPNFVRTKSKIQDFVLHPEVLESDRHNYKIIDNELGVGTTREKFTRNIEAIKVLKKCEDENRYATPEEQEVLSKYVGWGGLSQAFDEHNSSWADEYSELKNLLNEEEYKQARSSTLTAFYTPPIVINAIYQALQNMGLKQANILEPSCRCWKFFRNVT